MPKVKCLHHSDTSDKCNSCKSIYVDWVKSVQENLDWHDQPIRSGVMVMGKCRSVDDGMIKRIRKTQNRYIEVVTAGTPCCDHSTYTEGHLRNERLDPWPDQTLIFGETE